MVVLELGYDLKRERVVENIASHGVWDLDGVWWGYLDV